MKTILTVLLLTFGIGITPCRAAGQTEKTGQVRKPAFCISTDLMEGIRDRQMNLQFSYDFHPQWSLTAGAGIRTGHRSGKIGLRYYPSVISGFYLSGNLGKDLSTDPDKEQDTSLSTPPGKNPDKEQDGLPDRGQLPDLEFGLGWQISIGSHLICRIEVSTSVLAEEPAMWNEGFALQIGYRF